MTIFLDFPGDAFEAGTEFWRSAAGCGLSPFRGETGEFATLLPPDGDAYLRVQRIVDGPGRAVPAGRGGQGRRPRRAAARPGG
jgi:hypothetical protein